MVVTPALKTMNCVLYLRVSSEEQIENYSLSNQEDYCRKEAERKGLNILEIFREEGKSAKDTNRPELINLLEYCRKNKDSIHALLVYRLDRLSRQTSDYLAIRKKLFENGISIISASEPTGDKPTDKFVETLLAATAQLDNDIRGERSKQGLYQRFKDGWPIGKATLGYKNIESDGKQIVVPHEEDFEKMRKCWELMATGTKSLRQITKVMNDMGLRTYWNGKKFKIRVQSSSRIFRDIVYTAILKYNKYPGEEIRGKYKPMISEKTFYKVRSILEGRRTVPSGKQRIVEHEDFPLRNLIKCSCGSGFTGGWCKGRNKHYDYYWCSNPNHKSKSVRVKDMDEMLKKNLSFVQPTKEAVDLFLLILEVNYERRIRKLNERKAKAEGEVARLRLELKNLVRGDANGKYPKDIYEEVKAQIEDELLAARIVENENLIDKYDLEATSDFIRELLSNLPKAYEVSDYGQKQALIGSIYPSGITFHNSKLLNRNISPIYCDIRDVLEPSVSLRVSDGDRTRNP